MMRPGPRRTWLAACFGTQRSGIIAQKQNGGGHSPAAVLCPTLPYGMVTEVTTLFAAL